MLKLVLFTCIACNLQMAVWVGTFTCCSQSILNTSARNLGSNFHRVERNLKYSLSMFKSLYIFWKCVKLKLRLSEQLKSVSPENYLRFNIFRRIFYFIIPGSFCQLLFVANFLVVKASFFHDNCFIFTKNCLNCRVLTNFLVINFVRKERHFD